MGPRQVRGHLGHPQAAAGRRGRARYGRRGALPIPPYTSLYLLISPYISLHLPISRDGRRCALAAVAWGCTCHGPTCRLHFPRLGLPGAHAAMDGAAHPRVHAVRPAQPRQGSRQGGRQRLAVRLRRGAHGQAGQGRGKARRAWPRAGDQGGHPRGGARGASATSTGLQPHTVPQSETPADGPAIPSRYPSMWRCSTTCRPRRRSDSS